MDDDFAPATPSSAERPSPDRADREPPRRFETALSELEEIVAELESEDFGLEESLGKYQRGVGLVRAMHEFLRKAQRKIEKLSGFTEEGVPIVEPFRDDGGEEAAESPGGPADSFRARRPVRRSPNENAVDTSEGFAAPLPAVPPPLPEPPAVPRAPRAPRRPARPDSGEAPPSRGSRRARSDDAGEAAEVDDEPRLF